MKLSQVNEADIPSGPEITKRVTDYLQSRKHLKALPSTPRKNSGNDEWHREQDRSEQRQRDERATANEDMSDTPRPGDNIRTNKTDMEGKVERIDQNVVFFRLADGRLMKTSTNNVTVVEKLADGDDEITEAGWKNAVAAGAVALGSLGSGGAHAGGVSLNPEQGFQPQDQVTLNQRVQQQQNRQDLSSYSTEYLQKAADPNRFGRFMVSVDNAKAELQDRENGKQQTSAPASAEKPSSGYSKEYLEKAADPQRFGRFLISVEKAQELLGQMKESTEVNEMDNIITKYKAAIGKQKTAADDAGDYKKGDELYHKIHQATLHQGESDKRRAAQKAATEKQDVDEEQINELDRETVKRYVPARIDKAKELARTDYDKAKRVTQQDLPRALGKLKDKSYGYAGKDILFYAKLSNGQKVYARIKDKEQLGDLQQQYADAECKIFNFNRPDIQKWLEARRINLRKFEPGMVQTMGQGVAEGSTPGYIKYEQMKDKIAGVLIKLYDQGKDAETIQQMGARVAKHLGYDPEDSIYQDAWSTSFNDASLDGSFDQGSEDDYTDYSMRQGEMGRKGVAEGEEINNPADTVTVDVPLLIRIMEYAKEDAKTDLDLHNAAEKLIELSQEGRTLTMDDYATMIGDVNEGGMGGINRCAPSNDVNYQDVLNDVTDKWRGSTVKVEDAAPALSKDAYFSRRKELQRIQMDPHTSKSPVMKKELVRKKAQLDQQAQAAGLAETYESRLSKFLEAVDMNQFADILGKQHTDAQAAKPKAKPVNIDFHGWTIRYRPSTDGGKTEWMVLDRRGEEKHRGVSLSNKDAVSDAQEWINSGGGTDTQSKKSVTIDFNVDFAKEFGKQFYANISNDENRPTLMISLEQSSGLKTSHIRTQKERQTEGATKLPCISLSAAEANAAGLRPNGRYVLGPNEGDNDIMIFPLIYQSTVLGKGDVMKLGTAGLTVATSRDE